MLYDYIVNNYDKDEPIFLSELPGNSRDYVRQEMKQLADEGKVERLYNGVYYLSYMTILGTMLMYGKEASNRKQEIDRQHHTIPNKRTKDKHYGNVHNRLWNHG